jgi:uncharacterized protein YndB with AHSA1/START domain
MAHEYVFHDEWDVDAPIEDVFATLADPSTYPLWWRPVYRNVVTRGRVGVGHTSDHYFKGRLPYTLRMRAEMTEYDPPHRFAVEVDGDLRGTGVWTFAEHDGKTHVRWDWTVHADKPLLRVLTPLLRPLFRRNHPWAVARAREGLEPYVRGCSGSRAARTGAPVPTTPGAAPGRAARSRAT